MVKVRQADLKNEIDLLTIIEITNIYAQDKMGLERPLSPEVLERLKSQLPVRGGIHFIAEWEDTSVGIANCFMGFSTFYGMPLINIHDLAVNPAFRGKGVGGKLLDAVKYKAKELGCCKVTLEVRDDNIARHLYERKGFESDTPPMEFLSCKL